MCMGYSQDVENSILLRGNEAWDTNTWWGWKVTGDPWVGITRDEARELDRKPRRKEFCFDILSLDFVIDILWNYQRSWSRESKDYICGICHVLCLSIYCSKLFKHKNIGLLFKMENIVDLKADSSCFPECFSHLV